MQPETVTTTDSGWSAYDDAMPHVRAEDVPASVTTFAALREGRDGRLSDLSLVGEVIVVVSSSRGGSTLVGELLRRTPGLLSLRSEINPLFLVAGLGSGRAAERRRVFAAEVAAEIGRPAAGLGAEDVDAFAASLAWRLTAQWPAEGIDPADVRRWTVRALQELDGFPDPVRFHLRLLDMVRTVHPAVNPWYYDIPAAAVQAAFPDVPRPPGPPGPHVVEMPPFVLIGPWYQPTPGELRRHPLVLSTPRNAFRLSFLQSLFPAARFRVVHLVRNPAAAVNGLIDGWRHHGFFNTEVEDRLEIEGYSDDFPDWGRHWWNYDFWPGWRDWAGAPLPEVAAEQWRSHHVEVLRWLAENPVDRYRLRFEDIAGSPEERRGALRAFGDWLGIGPAGDVLATLDVPPVMATAQPRPGRWAERSGWLMPAVTTDRVLATAAELGYEDRTRWL